MEELIKDGLRPTEEAYKDQLLNAYLFGNNFKRNILRKDLVITTDRRVVIQFLLQYWITKLDIRQVMLVVFSLSPVVLHLKS